MPRQRENDIKKISKVARFGKGSFLELVKMDCFL